MSEPVCYGSLQVCALRAALLAANGAPDPGASNGYVTEALIKVDIAVVLSKDIDLEKDNGCGNICQSFFQKGKIKRATIAAALCELDIQLGQMLVGGDLFSTDGSVPIGWQVPHFDDPSSNGVCLEMWTRAWDGTAQATPTALGNQNAWWHWVFPKTRFALGKMTMQDDFLEFAVDGDGFENPLMWAHGPFHDWPDEIIDGGGITACLGLFLDANLPAAECAFITVPNFGS